MPKRPRFGKTGKTVLAAIVVSLLLAVTIVKLRLPPYGFLKLRYLEYQSSKKLDIPAEYLHTDVAGLIALSTADDINRLRQRLNRLIWGHDELPTATAVPTVPALVDTRYDDIASLKQIDYLRVDMEFGLESSIYHFIPTASNNRLVLFHQGHAGDFFHGKKQIRQFLDAGFAVAAFSMPLLGLNNQPTLHLPRLGRLRLTHHDQMKYLSPRQGHPVQYFIHPVIATLNYLEAAHGYDGIAMAGISGGGWTTILCAALDPRIRKSFSVAGSYPIYLRSNAERDWGDWEQTVPELYRTANYLELYVLGAAGQGRKQLQVINKYDPCCFAGEKWRTYRASVANQVETIGDGEFDLLLDDTHAEHTISDFALRRIMEELNAL